ncbi:o-succinylbenzoate synthase [Shewanella sp.]|uniref:o-succinylbenzoate synthase n=1 Tax=Shewanella sp. TaxID=50422 RepID=UPI00356240EA
MTSSVEFALYPYRIALSRPLPVGKQRIDHRQGLVLEARLDGVAAFAEIAPLSGNDIDGEALQGFSRESLDDCVTALKASLKRIATLDELEQAADKASLPAIGWGLGVAATKLKGLFGHSIDDNARTPTIPAVPLLYLNPGESLDALILKVKALPDATRFAKVKVAQTSMEEELRLIHAILAARPTLKLRLDANQGFELESAIDFCACLPLQSIDYIEEPCRNPLDNPALHRATGIGFALDESITSGTDALHSDPQAQGLKVLVLKPMLLGSPAKVQRLIDQAHALGVRCIISSSLESSLGIDALAQFAAITTPDEAPGLDTLAAFDADCVLPSGKSRLLTPSAPGSIQGSEIGASLL